MTEPVGARIGLRYGTVTLADHDPGWAAIAVTHRAAVIAALGPLALSIEHVGSTAVPGLPAKPIVDLTVRLAAESGPAVVIEALTGAGYVFRGDKGDSGGLLRRRAGARGTNGPPPRPGRR